MKNRIAFFSLLSLIISLSSCKKTDPILEGEKPGNGFAKYKLTPTVDPLVVSVWGLSCNGTNSDFITLKASEIAVIMHIDTINLANDSAAGQIKFKLARQYSSYTACSYSRNIDTTVHNVNLLSEGIGISTSLLAPERLIGIIWRTSPNSIDSAAIYFSVGAGDNYARCRATCTLTP